jgi:hypothetical protein
VDAAVARLNVSAASFAWEEPLCVAVLKASAVFAGFIFMALILKGVFC